MLSLKFVPALLKKLIISLSLFLFTFNIFGQELINPDSLPDVEDYAVVRTNPGADTIIIALHGGPTDQLYEGSFVYMESIPTFSVVEVKKHEMLSPVLSNLNLSFEEGEAVNDTTAALIQKAVQYYNDQDKVVVLLGQSWGAIILGEYLDDYGIEYIHRIIPMEGRLSAPDEFVELLLDGYLPTFGADGLTIIPGDQMPWLQTLLNLGAAAFANRWTDSLANMDMSKMMYTYAEYDMQTGALLEEEISFLEETGAQILFIPEGSHGDSFEDQYQEQILAFIRDEPISHSPEVFVSPDSYTLYPTLATDWVQIESTEQTGNLMILDMAGQLIHKSVNQEFPTRLDVSGFNSGQYVAVFADSENRTNTVRFQVVN